MVRIVTANVDNIESKVREVEQKLGIKSSDMISVCGLALAYALLGHATIVAFMWLDLRSPPGPPPPAPY